MFHYLITQQIHNGFLLCTTYYLGSSDTKVNNEMESLLPCPGSQFNDINRSQYSIMGVVTEIGYCRSKAHRAGAPNPAKSGGRETSGKTWKRRYLGYFIFFFVYDFYFFNFVFLCNFKLIKKLHE